MESDGNVHIYILDHSSRSFDTHWLLHYPLCEITGPAVNWKSTTETTIEPPPYSDKMILEEMESEGSEEEEDSYQIIP